MVDVDVDDWSAELDRLHARFAHRFARSEPRRRARQYLSGLVAGLDRKNGWTLAEHAGARPRWDAAAAAYAGHPQRRHAELPGRAPPSGPVAADLAAKTDGLPPGWGHWLLVRRQIDPPPGNDPEVAF